LALCYPTPHTKLKIPTYPIEKNQSECLSSTPIWNAQFKFPIIEKWLYHICLLENGKITNIFTRLSPCLNQLQNIVSITYNGVRIINYFDHIVQNYLRSHLREHLILVHGASLEENESQTLNHGVFHSDPLLNTPNNFHATNFLIVEHITDHQIDIPFRFLEVLRSSLSIILLSYVYTYKIAFISPIMMLIPMLIFWPTSVPSTMMHSGVEILHF